MDPKHGERLSELSAAIHLGDEPFQLNAACPLAESLTSDRPAGSELGTTEGNP